MSQSVEIDSFSLSLDNAHSAQSERLPVLAKLKWFNAAKGFGFVIPDERPVDAFLHITQLQKLGVHGLGEGAVILCDVDYGDKGASVLVVHKIIDAGNVPISLVEFTPANAMEGQIGGLVKWYKLDKGFGFIMPDDGMKDIFIHKSCLDKSGITELHAGQQVRVTYKTVQKGREALSVSVESNP